MEKNNYLNNKNGRKYNFNQNYFTNLSIKKAYILGYLYPLFKNRVRKCKICNQIKPIHAKDRCSNCYAKHKARWVGRGKNKKWQEAKWVKKVL
jgi:hypothetical protein